MIASKVCERSVVCVIVRCVIIQGVLVGFFGTKLPILVHGAVQNQYLKLMEITPLN